MNDFFDKLNTLMRAKLGDLIGDSKSSSASSTTDDPQSLNHVAKDAENLRSRANNAIEYEDKLEAQIDDIHQQLATLNRQADEATLKGNEAMARHFIEKIQTLEARLAQLEKDLGEHRLLAQDLIQKVNTLEATIADIQAQQPISQTDSTTQKTVNDKFSELVTDAQKRIHDLSERIKGRKEALQSEMT
ncbi:MAG: PspA/IM30 family protein, partial [Anaerolineae bacterium]|nr:PspA/IM30 family protein [Anaerolineae bacterium]